MSLKQEVMLCVHLILLPTIVRPLASTGCSPCSTRSAAWKGRYRAIRPTISRGLARTTIASRLQSPASPMLILRIEAKENTLTLRGEKQTNDEEKKSGEVLNQSIAARNFERSFQLADHVQVKGASLENGLLHIDLVREIPEAMKPRAIRSRAPAGCWRSNRLRSLPEGLTACNLGAPRLSGRIRLCAQLGIDLGGGSPLSRSRRATRAAKAEVLLGEVSPWAR
jgi:hypothetical protein